MAQKNGSIRTSEYYNQMLNNHQSLGGYLRASQGTLQRSQNYLNPNKSTPGYHVNNIGDAKTQPMTHFTSSSNNTMSLIVAARYGRTLPLTFPSGPPQHMGLRRMNSPFNDVGFRGYTNGFPNLLENPFNNQMNLPYLPYGENSHSMNDCFNPNPRVDMNNFHRVKDIPMSRILPTNQVQEADITFSRPKMTFTPLDYYEGMQPHPKELILFKDEKNPISTSEITIDIKENAGENMDLSLHL
ncbi:hypothetical protein SESBI_45022 [Sesbania bispinosa]|nr:hypothetical protein SESBI_45022 [Sesbania bispinosa]